MAHRQFLRQFLSLPLQSFLTGFHRPWGLLDLSSFGLHPWQEPAEIHFCSGHGHECGPCSPSVGWSKCSPKMKVYMSNIHVLCLHYWSLVPQGLGFLVWEEVLVLSVPTSPSQRDHRSFCSAVAAGDETEGLRCPCALSLSLQPPHPERLPWGQPLFRDGLSPEGDVGELRSWKQLLHPCNYCCIPLPTSQEKFSKLSIPSACAGAVSKT